MASTPLLKEQLLAGGVLVDDTASVPRTYKFCYPAVLHFGDPEREYHAAMSEALLFDLSDRAQIEMTGKDAQQFLHNFCTNDITPLEPGQGCEAFVTNLKGRVLAHVFVFVADDSVWIETTARAEETLLTHFDRYLISEDVQLRSRTEQFGELYLTGPTSGDKLSPLGIQSEPLGLLEQTITHHGDRIVVVRRVDVVREQGFLLSVDRTRLVSLWKELTKSGVLPGGAQAFHALRVESGFPLDGLDLSDQNLAQEAARTRRAISFTKGCYLGQEPIARIDALGHVNRELRGLRLSSLPPPEIGDGILAEDGRKIGVITSSAVVPGDDRPIALGYVRSSHVKPGTVVLVRVGDQETNATVFWREEPPPTQ
ncbi:MAG: hypothetical protein MI757_16045 [Pirellulales bacterium]|nr:hypothetical protein [Pirellulales bacterium]